MDQPRNTHELIVEFMDILRQETQRDSDTAVFRTMTAAALFWQACARAHGMTPAVRREVWLMAERTAEDLELQRLSGRH